MTKTKAKTVVVRVHGPIIVAGATGPLWRVRLIGPRFPFYIDSCLCFATKKQAELWADKWRKRKIVVSVR